MNELKNILVVSVNWLGDVIFSTPVYRVLKDNYPQAKVTALAVPRVENVLRLCPHVDDVIIYDEDLFDRPLLSKIAIVQKLKQGAFDAAFVLRPSFSRQAMLALAGIPVRVGFAAKGRGAFLTKRVSDQNMDLIHRSDVYLRVIEALGLKVILREPVLALDNSIKDGGIHFLTSRGIGLKDGYIVLNTGGNWDLKQWPWEFFAQLLKALVSEQCYKVVLTGSDKDYQRIEEIIRIANVPAINIAGETDLLQLAAVLSRAEVVISADSGPLHLANALQTPVVALFGPTRPEITGPRGSTRSLVLQKDVRCNRAPCYYLECRDNQCMKQIGVKDVLASLKTLKD